MRIMNDCIILPDGSAFGCMSFPLPVDHWIYTTDDYGYTGPPPMTFRMRAGVDRKEMENKIRIAAQYAVKASTQCGKDNDFDPDALVQNMIVGMLGYFTLDGLADEDWQNPTLRPVEHSYVILRTLEDE
jgi:hypothetical protein